MIPPLCLDCGAPCPTLLVCMGCAELRAAGNEQWLEHLVAEAEARWPGVDLRAPKKGKKRALKWGQSTDLNAFNQEEAVA